MDYYSDVDTLADASYPFQKKVNKYMEMLMDVIMQKREGDVWDRERRRR